MERSLIERVRREVQEVVNVLKKVTITPAMRTELEHAGAEENIGPLESALEFYKHVREPNVVARLTPESAAAEGHARNVRTRAYEHIYSVRYDDVPPAWRILYSVSSFALVHVFVEQQRPLSAIHTLDLALMMGHPDLSDIAHQLMKIVQRLRREADERESNEENGSSGASGRPQQGKGNSSARGGRGGNADDDDEDEDDEDDEEDGEAGGNDDDHEDETSGGADDTDGGASGGTSSGGDRRGRRGGGGGGGRGGGGRGGGGGGGRGAKQTCTQDATC